MSGYYIFCRPNNVKVKPKLLLFLYDSYRTKGFSRQLKHELECLNKPLSCYLKSVPVNNIRNLSVCFT
jgi:hypothetical protein